MISLQLKTINPIGPRLKLNRVFLIRIFGKDGKVERQRRNSVAKEPAKALPR